MHPPSGHDTVKRLLHGLQLFPLIQLASQSGKGIRPFLTEITGLSPARIAQGNLDKIRPSTTVKIVAFTSTLQKNLAKAKGWSDQEFDTHIAAIPRMRNGNFGPLSSWIHGMKIPGVNSLPLTSGHALKIDELIQLLSQAFDANDCTAFTQAILAMDANELNLVHTPEEESDVESIREDWRAAKNWDAVGALLPNLAENLLIDIYAALDAEWSGWYFPGSTPTPVFLWVAPRVNENFDPSSGALPSRNLVYRPVRRLLEFSYAVVHCHYKGRWPDKPVGRSELGLAIVSADSEIGNYFDGTCNLTLATFQNLWRSLCRHFDKNTKESKGIICPTPLAAVAIAWQRLLMETTNKQKFKSAHLLDEADYTRRWLKHRNSWPEKPPSGEFGWPDWLLNQSLVSDSMRSSQS